MRNPSALRTVARVAIAVIFAMLTASAASAGVHQLNTVSDNSTDIAVPVTDRLMVTITTSRAQGGNDATETLVSVGGTVAPADVAAINVYYAGLLEGSVSNPASLTNVTITLPGTSKGGADWTYTLSLNASAGGKTFNLTVTSITGTDNAVLPFTTATRNAQAGNQSPTVTINSPADASSIGGSGPHVIDGTASDSDGTVQSVVLTIARPSGSPTEWWNGTGWQGSSTTVSAVNTGSNYSTWNYSWNWTADMEGTDVDVTAVADDGTDTGSDTNTTTVDTTAPRVNTGTYANGIGLDPAPTSGDASFTLRSQWTELNPGTPEFDYDLNAAGYTTTWTPGTAGNNSTVSYGVGLTGSDYFTGITSRHSDSPYGNGPTTTSDTGPFYVLPLTPNPPTVANNGATDSLDVTIVANAGEGGTGMLYAIRCHDAGGTPTGFWVAQATGDCTAVSEDWQTPVTWGSPVVVGGLSSGTTYQFSVAAGNPKDGTPTTGERSASAYGTTGTATTSAGNSSPTVTINSPADASSIGGPGPYVIDGTASDSDGTVQSVTLTIARPSGTPTEWWNGTAWQGSATTVSAANTGTNYSTWNYSWSWTADMEGTDVDVTAEATDDQAATGTDTNTTTVDTTAPRVDTGTYANGVGLDPAPTSGDASFTLRSQWTELNPGTPEFDYDLNAAGYTTTWTPGTAGNNSTVSYGVGLTGSDYFTGITSRHTDSPYGNGPTTTADTGPFFVLPLTPNPPTVANNGATDSLDVTIVANPGEGGTGMLYAIRCHDAGGTPTGFWVAQATGDCTAASEDWQTPVTWGSPVVVGGLSQGTTYQFSVAAGNPKDGTPTTGERSASAYSTTGTATTSTPPADEVTVNPPSANVDGCNQITVTVTFTGDDNTSSTTLFERSPNGVDSWSPVTSCGAGNGVVSGASPRICVDTTVADNSTNYYRVDFTDGDGVVGTDPSDPIGPYDTSVFCSVDGTTIGAATAEASSCNQITVIARFTGDDNGDGSIKVEHSPAGQATWTTACAAASGASPRQCVVPGLDASTSYDVQITFTDPDGVAPDSNLTATTELITPTPSTVTTSACGTDQAAPTLLILAPSQNAVVGGTDRVKVQVFDSGMDTTPLASVEWSVDSDNDLDLTAATLNSNYDCGTDCAIYEFDLVTTALAQDGHYLTIKVVDTEGNIARLGWAFRVNNSGSKAAGDGFLLRRSHGSQLCIDCHNIKTHSSQSTSTKHGNWAVSCVACHTPHLTKNIYLIDDTVDTPNSGTRPVRFEVKTGAVADSSTQGTASYVNEDNVAQVDGICQACHTRTSDASGTVARWRNSDSGGNADSHYDSAETSQCTGCHSHETGFSGAGGACNTCHFAPPTVGKHGSHDEVGTLPTDYAGLVSTTTPTQYGFACAKCHSGSHFSDPSKPHTVEIVFDDTVDPKNTGGSYAPDGPSQATDPGVNGDGWYWSDGTCSNVYCHSNAAPLGGTDSKKTPTWDQATAVTCASCHNTEARDDSGGGVSDLSDTHGKHIQSTSGETGSYSFTCDECHSQTIKDGAADPWNLTGADFSATAGQGKIQHVDGEKDVFFSASATTGSIDQSGASYTASPNYTCSDSYCHSPGNKTSAFDPPVGTALAWSGGTSTCRSCHAGDATTTPTMDSGKHENHVNNAAVIGTNYECATCHDATVGSGDNEIITTLPNHVNGAKSVSGTLVDATYSSPTCTTSYCHSSGQDPANPSREFVTSPDWFTATGNALDCKGCHGIHSENAFTSVAGEPNYTNDGAGTADANSHGTHVTSAADCTNCHNSTTSTGTVILASAPHTDQNRDVVIASGWDTNGGDGTDNYTPASKSCAGVKCHGSGSPQWGSTLVCLDCHGAPDGGTLGDGTPNGVGAEWTSDGHGNTSWTISGDSGPLTSGLGGCDYCHQLDAGHTPTAGTNPYRLRFSTTDNTLCLQCHAAGDNGIQLNSAGGSLTLRDGNLDVDTAHFGGKHEGTEGGKLCWDCHDPHGVPTNILMVKALVSKNANQYGVPGTTVTVNFTDNTTAGAGVGRFIETTNTPRTGLCQACHDPAGQGGSGPTDYWRSNGTIETHNATQLCTDCHFHNADFKGAGGDCLGCHADAGDAGTIGANSRRPVQGDFGMNSHHVGASVDADGNALYTQPTMGGALTNYDCVVCHAEGRVTAGATEANDTLHKNGQIDLRNTDVADGGAGYYYSYDKDSITGASNTWMSGNTSWETQTVKLDRFCLSCHDVDGASVNFNSGANEGRGFTGSATNPFADSAITNENDQQSRGAVVNIRNKVDAFVDATNTSITPVDRDTSTGGARTNDGRADPTQGIFSRHAIRGDGSTWGASSVYGSSQIPTNRWEARPAGGSWNDTSLMGCADCHTTDGANTTNGNAHGAGTEYLLKNKDGSASTESGFDVRNADVSQINCYKCHTWTWYSTEKNSEHTDSSSDWVFTADQTGGTSRLGGNGNIYGLPCTNCHGGAPAAVGTGFGTIHGTSDTFNINDGQGNPAQRQAYRFMNGASLRYFDPGDWNASAVTCYTLGSSDSFGGCTQHPAGNGKGWTRSATRQIKY